MYNSNLPQITLNGLWYIISPVYIKSIHFDLAELIEMPAKKTIAYGSTKAINAIAKLYTPIIINDYSILNLDK